MIFNNIFDLKGPMLTITAASPREEIEPIHTSQRLENCLERLGM